MHVIVQFSRKIIGYLGTVRKSLVNGHTGFRDAIFYWQQSARGQLET